MTRTPLTDIGACVFDAYGTLLDFNAAVAQRRDQIGKDADKLSALWRQKQLEYTWLRSLMGRHADFWLVTTDALDFAMAQRAEEQARSGERMAAAAHRLNLLAAFFFPIAALTALFGVNLRHGMETTSAPLPFLAVLGAGLILGGLLTLFVTQPPPHRRSRSRAPARGRKTSSDSNRRFGGR